MEIKYTCSFGPTCQSSQILKRNKLKLCSYPFDWIFSKYDNIIHCIENDFQIFLDKSYYIDISYKMCGHSYYHKDMFGHHNPLNIDSDYNYYIRCIDRFRNMLRSQERKLFITTALNLNDDINNLTYLKQKMSEFNSKFSKYTTNYILLVIIHIKNKNENKHIFTYNDNIHFLELHTLSISNGVEFVNNNDNNYLDDIIKST